MSFKTENISETTKIAPMLFLPFIENSFKHGVLKNGKLNIKIALSCKDNNIYFSIENDSSSNETNSKGIGLDNMKKRLELLYKDNYKFEIDDKVNFFKVNLILKTSK